MESWRELRDYTLNEPFPLDKMGVRNPENTICELLRRTHEMIADERVSLNIRIAMTMAKKMGDKLHWYRKTLGADHARS